jgi:hypothetical protein
VKPDSSPRLPRSPHAPDNLLRLREDALRRLEQEERAILTLAKGEPARTDRDGSMTRRRTLRELLLVPLGVVGAIVARLFGGRRVVASVYAQSEPPKPQVQQPPLPRPEPERAPVYGGPALRRPQPNDGAHSITSSIQTKNGHLLSAVNGGGLGDPKSAPYGVALSTGAATAGPFETFTLVWVDELARTFALKTYDNHFVTAVNGGGIGGPDSDRSPVHTDSKSAAPSGNFTITLLADHTHVTIRTADGKHFLSAVNGGGVGGSNKVPIHTDATTMRPEAVFQLTRAWRPVRPEATVYGGPTLKPPN